MKHVQHQLPPPLVGQRNISIRKVVLIASGLDTGTRVRVRNPAYDSLSAAYGLTFRAEDDRAME